MRIKSSFVHLSWASVGLLSFWLGSAGIFSPAKAPVQGKPSSLSAQELTMEARPPSVLNGVNSTSEPSPSESESLGEDRPMAALGMASLVDAAFKDPNPITRRLAFAELLGRLTPENALEMRGLMVEAGAEGDQWRDFNYAWGALAGEEAFLFAASSEENDLSAAVAGWASANPTEALAMLDNLPADLEGQREQLARSVIEGLSDRDRDLATDAIFKLAGEGMEKTNELMAVVAKDALRLDGAENAARWTESLPDGALKGTAMREIAGTYASEDGEAAARWVERVAEEDYAAGAIEAVGRRWAASSPLEAVGWLETLPQGEGPRAGLRSAFGDWEDSDPYESSKYLSNMADSPERDAAISGFSRGYAWQDPEAAIAWAMDISDPQVRDQTLTRAGQVYLRRNAESARAWLESTDLSPNVKESILNSRRG